VPVVLAHEAHLHHTYGHPSRFVRLLLEIISYMTPLYIHPLLFPSPSTPPKTHTHTHQLTRSPPSPADLVQDLYLRELKGYKSPAVKPSDAEGHVQKWVAPKAPQSPEESDIASELKSYESSAVDVEGQAEAGAGGAAGAAEEQDWFEEEPEEEEAHH
jgi:F-type H+-transporting ATPase subunit h